MKLELILPIQENKGYPKGLRMPPLTLPALAALTPPGIDVIVTEEETEEIVYKDDVDLAGISFVTPTAPRAFEIAEKYRKRGTKVVLGGMHASALPDEAIDHADSVVIGEAENVWQQVIQYFRSNRLKRFYRSDTLANLCELPIPRRDLQKKMMTFSPYSIQTTRGCPFFCDFCIVTAFFGNSFRFRPIPEVIEEIEMSGKKNWIFVDDNIIGHKEYARKLFQELAHLKIRWVGQSSLLLGRDDTLMKMAAESGCVGLFIGFESLSSQNLRSIHKDFNKVEHFEDSIKKLHDHGILVQASFIFGLDYDDKHVFEKTVAFLIRNKIAAVSFSILTPFPGSKLHERFEKEGRIISRDWSKYDYETVVYKPKWMTPEELEEGKRWAGREFYSNPSILSRFSANRRHPLLYSVVNLSYRSRQKKGLRRDKTSAGY